MNFIVLDLEWNQAANKKSMIRTPVYLHGEIIQIGAVKLDETCHILDTFKIMVSPKYYCKMNQKVSELTGITTEDLQYGFPFSVAFRHFKKWCGEDFKFLTWGGNDIGVFNDNVALHKLDGAWLPETYNIQLIFDSQITKEKRAVSLTYAMEKLGEPVLETHDALHDARNTACVCSHLDMMKGLAEYAELQKSNKKWYGKRDESVKTYVTREEALADPNLTQFCYPECGSMVTCVDIIRQTKRRYIGIGKFGNGEELFVRFKFTRWDDGKFSVCRILYEMDENRKRFYLEKKRRNEEAEAAHLQRLAVVGCLECLS